jgi:hypothetical protein
MLINPAAVNDTLVTMGLIVDDVARLGREVNPYLVVGKLANGGDEARQLVTMAADLRAAAQQLPEIAFGSHTVETGMDTATKYFLEDASRVFRLAEEGRSGSRVLGSLQHDQIFGVFAGIPKTTASLNRAIDATDTLAKAATIAQGLGRSGTSSAADVLEASALLDRALRHGEFTPDALAGALDVVAHSTYTRQADDVFKYLGYEIRNDGNAWRSLAAVDRLAGAARVDAGAQAATDALAGILANAGVRAT